MKFSAFLSACVCMYVHIYIYLKLFWFWWVGLVSSVKIVYSLCLLKLQVFLKLTFAFFVKSKEIHGSVLLAFQKHELMLFQQVGTDK